MNLAALDILIFIAFFALVVGISIFKSRRESSGEDYFLAGRGLTWPFIGLSIVAANISTEQFVGMSGQGAGSAGLAVSNWQLVGSIGIVIIAFTLLPRFLKSHAKNLPDSSIEADIKSRREFEQYQHLERAIQVVRELGYEEAIRMYADHPGKFKELVI